jgi:hypothetical protein
MMDIEVSGHILYFPEDNHFYKESHEFQHRFPYMSHMEFLHLSDQELFQQHQ